MHSWLGVAVEPTMLRQYAGQKILVSTSVKIRLTRQFGQNKHGGLGLFTGTFSPPGGAT